MPTPLTRQSIARVVALALVVVTTLVLGLFAAYNYQSEQQRRKERLLEDQSTWVEQLAVALEPPVWNFDRQQIDEIIESSMRDREILTVIVQLADRHATRQVRTRDAKWQVIASTDPPPPEGKWIASRDITGADETLGRVTVHVTPRFLEEALARTLRWMLLTIAVFDALLTTCLYMLLKWLVLRPLSQLENHAVALSEGTGELAALEALRFRGEIERLRRAVAGMVTQLRRRFAELQLTTASLREAQERELSAREQFAAGLLTTQELERRRIASDLHDSVGQELSLIANRAQLALGQPGLPGEASLHLESIIRSSRTAISEVRAMVRQLRPLHIEQLGFTASLDGLLDQIAEASSLAIDRHLDNIDDLVSGDRATHLYRLAQEALNNAMRHAQALRASVQLERDLDCVRLRILDDGRGFAADEERFQHAGLGLTSMRERARLLGGTLRIQSTPGGGTSITLVMPFSDAEELTADEFRDDAGAPQVGVTADAGHGKH